MCEAAHRPGLARRARIACAPRRSGPTEPRQKSGWPPLRCTTLRRCREPWVRRSFRVSAPVTGFICQDLACLQKEGILACIQERIAKTGGFHQIYKKHKPKPPYHMIARRQLIYNSSTSCTCRPCAAREARPRRFHVL
jgi:hypothetical protein